ncbi:MAG: hypothetical protein SFT94_03770 [Pseudanabaenaceae cyanobacterium bins.68]|nr:hypothetical protein [Pseudanabaenaceae cyanobacterium bins.68]
MNFPQSSANYSNLPSRRSQANTQANVQVSNLQPVSPYSRSQAQRDQQEALSDYVAHLQLHMALQARNLVPHLPQPSSDSRSLMLHKTQADFEKVASRQ